MPFIVRMERTSLSKLKRVKANIMETARESKAARTAAYNSGRRMRRVFEATTKTWTHNVDWKLNVSATKGSNVIFYVISNTDQIWHWLDAGTTYRKVASDPRDPFISKTSPSRFFSGPCGGKLYFMRKGDSRPGITPRKGTRNKKAMMTAELLLEAEVSKQFSKLRRELEGA